MKKKAKDLAAKKAGTVRGGLPAVQKVREAAQVAFNDSKI